MAERFYSGLRTQNRDQPSSGLPVSLPGLTPTRARNTPTRRESRQESVKEIDHVQLLRAYTELQKQNNGLLVLTAKMTQEMQCLRRETQDVKDMIMNKGCNGKEAQNESAETKKLPKDLTVSNKLMSYLYSYCTFIRGKFDNYTASKGKSLRGTKGNNFIACK